MKEFELKEEHLKLLREAYVRWDSCEYGAPAIDSKRPFGNSGRHTILLEMAEILGIPTFKDYEGNDSITQEQAEYLEVLWRDTDKALQIVLLNLKEIPLEKYVADNYSKNWNLDTGS